MFKFLKSKKGFTLVELMIVVVIMAILVVIAVPIYNTVTDNAREKTCLDNQRQVLSVVGNLFAMHNLSGVGESVTLEFVAGENSEIRETANGALSTFSSGNITVDTIKASFQTIPVCGAEENIITAVISVNTQGTARVQVSCSDTSHKLS